MSLNFKLSSYERCIVKEIYFNFCTIHTTTTYLYTFLCFGLWNIRHNTQVHFCCQIMLKHTWAINYITLFKLIQLFLILYRILKTYVDDSIIPYEFWSMVLIDQKCFKPRTSWDFTGTWNCIWILVILRLVWIKVYGK